MTRMRAVACGLWATSVAACSSASEPAETPQVLGGTYEAMSPGTISDITFQDTGAYSLTRSPCDNGGVCTETGTYVLNNAHDVLTLTSATGQKASLPFQELMMPLAAPEEGSAGNSDEEVTQSNTALTPADAGALVKKPVTLVQPKGSLIQAFSAAGQSFVGNGEVIPPFDHCDPKGPCPDVQLNASLLGQQIVIETRDVAPNSCSVQEGTIGGSGRRRLLRFTTGATNIGTADLFLGNPATGDPRYFEFAPCHGHYHFKGYAEYELLTTSRSLAIKGRKESFCIEDNIQGNGRSLLPRPREPLQGQPTPPDVWTTQKRTYCHHPGLHRGWTDAYYNTTEGNWIDITGLAPGDYILSVTINPEHMIAESNYNNNHAEVPVHVPDPSADGKICPAGSDAIYRCIPDKKELTKCFRGVTSTSACARGCGQPQEIAHQAICL